MPTAEIVRAWTDTDYRATLASYEREYALDHPSGSIDAELDQVLGIFDPDSTSTSSAGCSQWSGGLCCC